jgi:hypothetical protein
MIAFTNTSTEPFAATLVIAWTDPNQRSEVSSIGEGSHIPADFGKQDLNGAPTQTRDSIQPLDLCIIGAQAFLDDGIEAQDRLVVMAYHLQKFSQEHPMMIADPSTQCKYESLPFVCCPSQGHIS